MRSSITILIDAREKKPLSFRERYSVLDRSKTPDSRTTALVTVETKSLNLDHADYYIAPDPHVIYTTPEQMHRGVIERKASIDEIAQNCLNSVRRARFIASLRKMRERWAQPLLIVEGGFHTLLEPSRNCPDPHLACDALLDLTLEYGIPVVPFPSTGTLSSRYTLAEYVFRFLYSATVASPVLESHTWPQPSK